jgi:hypothetical protein
MKTRFIRIQSLEDIDPSMVTVYDLSNRYIDAQGNMYGLRFNKQAKKIEIIKIIRTPAKTAPYFQQKLVQQKQYRSREGGHRAGSNGIPEVLEADDGHAGEIVEMEFDPGQFVNSVLEMMKTHKDRLGGIIVNIKNSKIVLETDRMDYNVQNAHFRDLEVEGIRKIEKLLDSQKELASYPRSISYYQSKLDGPGRKIFDELGDDARRMKFIYYWEMYTSIKQLYTVLYKALMDMDFFLSEKNIETKKSLVHTEKQNFQDGMISIGNTIKEISGMMKDLKKLEKFVSTSDNF